MEYHDFIQHKITNIKNAIQRIRKDGGSRQSHSRTSSHRRSGSCSELDVTPPVSVKSRIATYDQLNVVEAPEEPSVRKQVEDRIRPAVESSRSLLPLQMGNGYHSIYNDPLMQPVQSQC